MSFMTREYTAVHEAMRSAADAYGLAQPRGGPMKYARITLTVMAALCAVLAVAGFVASVWTMGDPHDLSRKYVLTAVLAGYVGMALLVAASSVPKWWPVPERQENR